MKSYMAHKQLLIDSNIWIGAFLSTDTNHGRARALLKHATSHGYELVSHKLIVLEVLTVLKIRKHPEFRRIAQSFFDIQLTMLDETPLAFSDAFMTFFLSLPHLSVVDAFLLHLAKQQGYHLATFDKDLAKASKKYGVRTLQLA